MKKTIKLFGIMALAVIGVFIAGCNCADNFEIINKEYKYEKRIFENYSIEFDFTLANISNNTKISNLIKDLIYNKYDFDEYVVYEENLFIRDIRSEYFPVIIEEDGSTYIYRSSLNIEYSIEYYCRSFIIVKYSMYFYYTGTPHGSYWINYYIIDLSEKKLLEVDDILQNIPDDILKEMIESQYNIRYYLRDNIWPPDTINFNENTIELLWNIYQITPYSDGIITIEINEIMDQYLTEKGKKLLNCVVYNSGQKGH